MGTENAYLLRAWQRAKRAGDKTTKLLWEKLIDQSQAECPHPPRARKTRRTRSGRTTNFCGACSKVFKTVP